MYTNPKPSTKKTFPIGMGNVDCLRVEEGQCILLLADNTEVVIDDYIMTCIFRAWAEV